MKPSKHTLPEKFDLRIKALKAIVNVKKHDHDNDVEILPSMESVEIAEKILLYLSPETLEKIEPEDVSSTGMGGMRITAYFENGKEITVSIGDGILNVVECTVSPEGLRYLEHIDAHSEETYAIIESFLNSTYQETT